MKNPKVKREIVRLLWPVWDEAIATTITARAETSFVDEADRRDLENWLLALMTFWNVFHRIVDRQIPPDIGDFPFRKPDCIDFDCMRTPMQEQINKILTRENPAETSPVPPPKAALDEE